MIDILDEQYEEFKLLVEVVTDELREKGSYLLVGEDIDEDLADGIAATAAASLGDPVYPIVYSEWHSLPSSYMYRTASNSTTPKYYINQPIVLACPTELENVWFFYIERD